MEVKKYWYCNVSVKGISRTYSYISDMGEITVNSYVEVPFGSNNISRIGIVQACGEYSTENAPYPPAQTKHIIRIASIEDYLQDTPRDSDEDDPFDEFSKINEFIAYAKWDDVLEWACDHPETTSPIVAAKVMECYELCIKQNMPDAFLNLGTFYYKGIFVDQDYQKAFELYKVAADAGLKQALCNCGYCFYYGRHQEVDYAEAYRYFLLGALLHNDANCLYKLGDMYLNGYHVEKNEKYAFMLFDRALKVCRDSENGDPAFPDVQFRIGKCLLYGIGVERNVDEAHTTLSFALLNFYQRRQTDPFVQQLIASTKKLIAEAQKFLDADTITRD